MIDDKEPQILAELRDLGRRLIELSENKAENESSEFVSAIPLDRLDKDSSHINDKTHISRLAQEEYRERLRRKKFFDADLFGEPAWDILLDLFLCHVEGRRITITSACIASSVPSTTALRWIALLQERGLIQRESDILDRRRSWIDLTPQGYQKIGEYLLDRAKRRRKEGVFLPGKILRGSK